jgi:hypothetical protein
MLYRLTAFKDFLFFLQFVQPMPGQRKREIYRIRRSWSNVFTQPFLEMLDAAAHLAQNFGSQTKRSRGGSDGEDEDDDRGDHSYGQMRPHKLQTTEINRLVEPCINMID